MGEEGKFRVTESRKRKKIVSRDFKNFERFPNALALSRVKFTQIRYY